MKFIPILVVIVVASSACTTYNPPPYKVIPPKEWKGTETKVEQPSLVDKKTLENWWTVFEDKKLDELERLAIVQNPTLQSAFFHIEESRAQLTIAESYMYPSLDLSLVAQRRRLPKDPIAAFQQITPNSFVTPGGESLSPVTLLMPKSPTGKGYKGSSTSKRGNRNLKVSQKGQKGHLNNRNKTSMKGKKAGSGKLIDPFFPPCPPCPPPPKTQTPPKTKTTASTTITSQYVTFLQVLPQVYYELDIWRKFSQAAQAQESDVKANEEAYKVALLSLTYEMAQQYFTLRALDAELDVIKRNIQARKDYLEINAARFISGITTKIDFLNSDAELENLEGDYEDRKAARTTVENAIAALLGLPASLFKIEAQKFKPKYLDIPVGLPSELLQKRPDIRQSEHAVESERLRVGVAKANMFPSLIITAFAGYEAAKLSNLFKWRNRVWSIAGQLFGNIFDAGNLRAQIQVEKEKYFQTVASYIDVVTVAFREVEDALASAKSLQKQQVLKTLELKNYSEVLYLVQSQYKSGIVDYLQVIDAEQIALQTERALVLSDRDRLLSSLLLIKSLGGTW